MLEVEEDVEGCPVPDEGGVGAVPVVEDGPDCEVEVRSRTVESHRHWSLPSLQQRLQVVQEGEVPVGGVGHGLVTVEGLVPDHQVPHHPEVLPQLLLHRVHLHLSSPHLPDETLVVYLDKRPSRKSQRYIPESSDTPIT